MSQGRSRLQQRSRTTAPQNCLGKPLNELLLIVSIVETCCHFAAALCPVPMAL